MCKVYFKNDSGWKHEFEEVWLYPEWATLHGRDGRDTGIDIVAKRRNGKFCAIQCKFFRAGYRISKGDIDSFFTASGTSDFDLRIVVDSTSEPWSEHADAALRIQDKQALRVSVHQLENSDIDWLHYLAREEVRYQAPKKPRKHQKEAVEAIRAGLDVADRGKLIMACGTGKTYTSLKLAEEVYGQGHSILFMVPSLALMGQAIRDWTLDSTIKLRVFAVCSDSQVGKRKKSLNDDFEIEIHDLEFPSTTNAQKLAEVASVPSPRDMTVVFSTYQSIHVIEEAQKTFGLPDFDLIICDEAHRTTGATLENTAESNFVRIHSNENVRSSKRLYMTATPKVYGNTVKSKAKEESVELYSMDNPDWYGETLYAKGFSWAIDNNLLTDYRVIVLAVDEKQVSRDVAGQLAEGRLKLDDATKIIGCYKALIKEGIGDDFETSPEPMKRGLAFCKDIASSKLFESEFKNVVNEFLASEKPEHLNDESEAVSCSVRHVDGTVNAKVRLSKLDWLRENSDENESRILTNARCLSEGIDVPALDGIIFLHPRQSQIDVVQAVGRVMRRSPGKKTGFIILPVGVPPGVPASEALNDNKRYKVIWDILNALRSHDERIDAAVNSGQFEKDGSKFIEVIAVSDNLPLSLPEERKSIGIGDATESRSEGSVPVEIITQDDKYDQVEIYFEEFSKAIMAKIVKKCGRRDYWEDWAKDIARIADQHKTRISTIIESSGTEERVLFEKFLIEIRDDLNDSITKDEAIEMLAQHLITRPVFDALFEDYKFSAQNSVSIALQRVIDSIDKHNINKEADSLERFYDSVRRRAKAVDNAEARQAIIVELYNKFFVHAFPQLVKKLGIVYTPVEIVDFLLHTVNDILRSEFDQTLSDSGVHILEPFVGTGTFVTRLIQSDIIPQKELRRKYTTEIHANEIVLLAYYIAAINIEQAYHERTGENYEPFQGICLTDTFQLFEQDKDLIGDLMEDNSTRRTQQKNEQIRVIVGNPPYSIGQRHQNDNAQNTIYPKLRELIEGTYAKRSTAVLKRTLYDSYIMAIKWASIRIGEKGVIAFVTNAGWLETKATDGMRKSLEDEFSTIIVIHLRGNLRTSGIEAKKEGESVFEQGTRTPIALTILVKNPSKKPRSKANIRFFDIGDYKSRTDKMSFLSSRSSLNGISADEFETIIPDKYGDWLHQRSEKFDDYICCGDKSGVQKSIFEEYSLGIATNRDAWAYSSGKNSLEDNICRMIETYNKERRNLFDKLDRGNETPSIRDLTSHLTQDPAKISWTSNLLVDITSNKKQTFSSSNLHKSLYRPFTKQWLYYDRRLNERVYRMPRIFPIGIHDTVNRVIMIDGKYNGTGMFALMSDCLPDLNCVGITQCFPLFVYSRRISRQNGNLYDENDSGINTYTRSVTRVGLETLTEGFGSQSFSHEDVFYYIYGVLHSYDYLNRYKNNLSKQLPRIPKVRREVDFWRFSEAGRKLGDLHCGYEDVEPYKVRFAKGNNTSPIVGDDEAYFRVRKMKFARRGDKSTVIYNNNIALTDIPQEAYEYVINKKSAIEWVMDRQCVRTDKRSGIVNDANHYALQTIGNAAYPLQLFQKVITVSLETMKIVKSLPELDIDD